MKYRKKPLIIEATQWFPGADVPGVEMHTPPDAVIGGRGHGEQRFAQDPRPGVVTIHGQVAWLEPGDWVITEPDGIHHYPCKPEIFATTYEPAEHEFADLPPAYAGRACDVCGSETDVKIYATADGWNTLRCPPHQV